MSKKVYGLKRATPKMKYQHMKMVLEFRADLKESQARMMSEGTREYLIEEIKRMMGGGTSEFHTWFDLVYKFRSADDMPTYEKKIRNKYYYLRRKLKKANPATSPIEQEGV